MKLVSVAALNISDAQMIRVIRNECFETMTRDRRKISEEEQLTWWNSLNLVNNKLYLYNSGGHVVGYGYARCEGGRWLISGGLLKKHRNKGLGIQLFGHLLSVVKTMYMPCWLEVLSSNYAGLKIYRRLGFKETDRTQIQGEDSDIITMKHDDATTALFKVHVPPEATHKIALVIESGYIGQGPVVDQFEKELQTLLQSDREVLTVNSGTSALDLALHLAGVGPGDEVVTTAMTCTATNGVIVNRGAIPVWADVIPETGLIDPASVARKMTKKTKAIMAVDWAGHACDYDELRKLGPPVIEDAAHAILTEHKHRPISWAGGDYVCYSFQAIKHLTTGDGGAIIVPKHQTEEARKLRWFGLDRRSKASFRCEQNIDQIGYKSHMNDIAAAIGLTNLKHVERLVELHRGNAWAFHERLDGVKHIKLPYWDPYSSWWLYTLLVEDTGSFKQAMATARIDVSPVHARNDKHTGFQRAAALSPMNDGKLPGLDYFSSHEIAIPVGWWLTADDIEHITYTIQQWDSSKGKS